MVKYGKRVVVTNESDTGRNLTFQDKKTGEKMNRQEFVRQIENNNYPDYYVREINGLKTPVSKPDGKKNNNLG